MLLWSREKAPEICGSQHQIATQIRVAIWFYEELDNYERNKNLYLNSNRMITEIITKSVLLEQLKFK
jgi:hypothetical protein